MLHASRITRLVDNKGEVLILLLAAAGLLGGCRTPAQFRHEADQHAYRIVQDAQSEALGRTEPFTIERPADTLRRRLLVDGNLPHATATSRGICELEPIDQWPDAEYLKKPDSDPRLADSSQGQSLCLTLIQALEAGAHNSREYQSQKEAVFRAALALDLQRDLFDHTWAGLVSGEYQADHTGDDVKGLRSSGSPQWQRRLKSGATLTAMLAADLVKLLTLDRSSSMGLFADASVSVPLLRGSRRFVVTEPLTLAKRRVIYAIYDFERFKRTFAVMVATDYLSVLEQWDQVNNAEENYRRLIRATRRARRLAQAGRLARMEVDQARQDELRARDRWIAARQRYQAQLDEFKLTLGLPVDAALDLDPDELHRLATSSISAPEASADDQTADQPVPPADAPINLEEPGRQNAGPLELPELDAIKLALENRLDLRTLIGRIHDAQRAVAVSADQLRADLTLLGSASAGQGRSLHEASTPTSALRLDARYSALLTLDLPLERTAEGLDYRSSLIDLYEQVRQVQDREDQIKLQVRNTLRNMAESRQSMQIQAQAVGLAEQRVRSTELFLQAGQAQIRDLLEAQEALVVARNALTSARVRYRVAELQLQRDMGVLQVNQNGLWSEYRPQGVDHETP